MLFSDLTAALGYADAPLYREGDGAGLVAAEDLHLVRAARDAGAKGTFFFRTSPEGGYRPAVHLAEVGSADQARLIHQRLWNQGANPFLIVLLPGEIRVYAGFEFHPTDKTVGRVETVPISTGKMPDIAKLLAAYRAEAINRGELWETQKKHLKPDGRVDATLLSSLETLSKLLQDKHNVSQRSSHALIGRFVYLHYLHARKILTPEWMEKEAGIREADVFSSDATLAAFRKLSKEVEATFNGRIFPIPWGAKKPPRADAIREVARVFAGEEPSSGQLALPFSAYDFSWIPIELLSSIYEQFLHAESSDASSKDGAHYTPEPLAEYLVSEVQSVRPLRAGMRILDPCCGSGVFLVVAFRRLVEMECARQRCHSLPPQEVKKVLTHSIYAVERNRTACEITAFSLILAMLAYVKPQELHRLKKGSFKFPSLIGKNLFAEDFFASDGLFWKKTDPETKETLRFDWILGNPPWLELEEDDAKAKPMRDWMNANERSLALARGRTGEAFAWKVREKLADDGVAGLVLAAKTLTNDHLKPWRAKFFSSHRVYRITNFANLAYVIFPKVKEAAMTVTFGLPQNGKIAPPILHVGPFVANQVAISHSRKAWVVGITESEMKSVDATDASRGNASTWKLALWGNHRDTRELARLNAIWPTTLKSLADTRGWCLALGLQLRSSPGKKWVDKEGVARQENEEVATLSKIHLLNHKPMVRAGRHLHVSDTWMIPPSGWLGKDGKDCYVRTRGGIKGVGLVSGPHLFLWNDFAAFSANDFIIEHDKIGLAGPSADGDWLRAVSLIWTASVTRYQLVLELSAAWGIGRTQIDLGDAENVRVPILDDVLADRLGGLHREMSDDLAKGRVFDARFQRDIDERVAKVLKMPKSLMDTATDFAIERMNFNQGVVPDSAKQRPTPDDLRAYAARLTAELDDFISGKGHHRIAVLHSAAGICASIEITREKKTILPTVRAATGTDAKTLSELLAAAEQEFSQWVYVKRSVRIMIGDTLHLIKPSRRCEWTEGRALLDAADVIAEIAACRK
jgi:hypothetical protein